MDNLEQNPPRQYLTQVLKLVYRNPRKKVNIKIKNFKKLIKNQERQASIETCRFVGAGNQNRTDDLVITNDVLYRLSHTSMPCFPHDLSIISQSFLFVNSFFSFFYLFFILFFLFRILLKS